MRRINIHLQVLVLAVFASKRVGSIGVYIGHDSEYFYHNLEDYSSGEKDTVMEYPFESLNDVAKEAFIIGVDQSFIPESNKLEQDLENIFGRGFFENNKFQLFLAFIVVSSCLVLCCCIFSCKKALMKWKKHPRKPFRPISFTDKFLESGMPQETFQFMPLRALSPLMSPDFEFDDEELPDYSQLQGKKIYPNDLCGKY